MYSLPSTSQMRAPSPRLKNCGKLSGSSAAFWWPYIPLGITAAARSRSAASAARGRLAAPVASVVFVIMHLGSCRLGAV